MPDAPKTMQLAPADWRQLYLLNVAQLHDYVSSIPAHVEGGTSALTDEAMAFIDAHLDRGRAFLVAWRKSRVPGLAAQQPAQTQQTANGQHAPKPKKKGGWPLGKPRKAKPQAEKRQ